MKCWNVSWYNEIHLVLSHRKSPFPSPDLRQPRPRGVGRAAPGFQAFDRTGGGLTGREARRTDVKLCNSLVKGRPVFPEWSERYWNGSVDQNVTVNSSSLYSGSLEEFIISTFPLLNDRAKKWLGKAMHLVVTFGSTKKRRDTTTLDEHAFKIWQNHFQYSLFWTRSPCLSTNFSFYTQLRCHGTSLAGNLWGYEDESWQIARMG